MKSRIDPREVEVDDRPIPPVRTISVFVPDADGTPVFCSATITRRPENVARLDTAPQDGPPPSETISTMGGFLAVNFQL